MAQEGAQVSSRVVADAMAFVETQRAQSEAPAGKSCESGAELRSSEQPSAWSKWDRWDQYERYSS